MLSPAQQQCSLRSRGCFPLVGCQAVGGRTNFLTYAFACAPPLWQVAQTVSKEFGVRGDVSVIVADVAPAGAAEAACAARPAPEKACQQGRGKQGERGGCGFLGRLFSGAK